MKFRKWLYLIRSDLYRYAGNNSFVSFLGNGILSPGFIYSFWMRTCTWLHSSILTRYIFFPFARIILSFFEYWFGISISHQTQIGPGLYIGHHGGIVVNKKAVIGRNCNLSHQVTIGIANRGEHKGVPVIGDNVYIGPGAKLIGRIQVGNNVAIGANCVVTKDAPENAVVVGIPGKVISYEGSIGYINKTDYEEPD